MLHVFNLFSQLRKAVVDHVSDTFLETNVPLLVLIEAAKAGDEKGVEEYAQVFSEHANKLVEVFPFFKNIHAYIQAPKILIRSYNCPCHIFVFWIFILAFKI